MPPRHRPSVMPIAIAPMISARRRPVSAIIYFANMWLAALMFFLLTGTIGFYACYWFVFKIFSSIKVD